MFGASNTVINIQSRFKGACHPFRSWWLAHHKRFPQVKTLLLNQDNGPENHSRRTQFMKRIVEFAQRHCLNIRLAYYPPYHSNWSLD